MLVVADTHVHLYSAYDLGAAFDAAFTNLGRLLKAAHPEGTGDGAVKLVCLTERRECHFFKGLSDGTINIPGERYTVHNHGDQVLMVSRDNGEDLLLVVAGRQIVTRERLEVLALTIDADIPDGLAVEDVIARIQSAGGIPVVTWAVGKWMFGRSRVVRRVIESGNKGSILVGDSSLRPAGWGEPKLMRLARDRGLRVIAGSDPLPFRGDEVRIGSYGIVGQSDFNWRDPLGSIRAMLLACPALRVVGERGDLGTVWGRLMAHRKNKRTSRAPHECSSTEPPTPLPAVSSR